MAPLLCGEDPIAILKSPNLRSCCVCLAWRWGDCGDGAAEREFELSADVQDFAGHYFLRGKGEVQSIILMWSEVGGVDPVFDRVVP